MGPAARCGRGEYPATPVNVVVVAVAQLEAKGKAPREQRRERAPRPEQSRGTPTLYRKVLRPITDRVSIRPEARNPLSLQRVTADP